MSCKVGKRARGKVAAFHSTLRVRTGSAWLCIQVGSPQRHSLRRQTAGLHQARVLAHVPTHSDQAVKHEQRAVYSQSHAFLSVECVMLFESVQFLDSNVLLLALHLFSIPIETNKLHQPGASSDLHTENCPFRVKSASAKVHCETTRPTRAPLNHFSEFAFQFFRWITVLFFPTGFRFFCFIRHCLWYHWHYRFEEIKLFGVADFGSIKIRLFSFSFCENPRKTCNLRDCLVLGEKARKSHSISLW